MKSPQIGLRLLEAPLSITMGKEYKLDLETNTSGDPIVSTVLTSSYRMGLRRLISWFTQLVVDEMDDIPTWKGVFSPYFAVGERQLKS